MPIAPYQAMNMLPGMLSESYTVEHDLADLFYGSSLMHQILLNYARFDGASVDTGNTGFTNVLRPGLIMAKVTASQKWKPFVSGASDGTQYARGILVAWGLNTQYDGAGTDRFFADILVGGIVNPEACAIAATAGYGLPRTGAGLAVRKHLMYTIRFSDDFENDLTIPLSGR